MSASVIICDDVFSFQVVEVFWWYGARLSWVINVYPVTNMGFKNKAPTNITQLDCFFDVWSL